MIYERINPLSLINLYVSWRQSQGLIDPLLAEGRDYLQRWVETIGKVEVRNPGDVPLAIDTLIAAGFGREQDQTGTVYSNASYE